MEPVEFEQRLIQTETWLYDATRHCERLVVATSLGAEDMVVFDLVQKHRLQIPAWMLDTGRLHPETYAFLAQVEAHYGTRIHVATPDQSALEALVQRDGINGFYASVDARKACCDVRKVQRLTAILAGQDGWLTGQRRAQSVTRDRLEPMHWDTRFELWKFNPLVEWSRQDVWHYLTTHQIPTHPLHAQQMPSIGCAPCTRPITAGEDERAGRWWWEAPAYKECGLNR